MKKDRFIKVITSSILIGSIVLLAMLPTFAYTVDGVELVEITLTYEDYQNMFASGDFTVQYTLSSPTSVDISLFDMYQNATSQIVTITSTPTVYPLTEILFSNSNIIFTSRYAYNLRVNSNASLLSQVVFDLPFGYYLDSASFTFGSYISGTSTTDITYGFSLRRFIDNSSEAIYSRNITTTPSIRYWSDVGSLRTWVTANNITTFPSGYTFDMTSTGIRTKYSSASYRNISTDLPVDQILLIGEVGATHMSGTGYDNSFIVPMVTSAILPLTVYVMPDIADTVEEYLDLIVNPSAEDQARIDELKDKFDSVVDDLSEAKDNIHKDMPTLPGVSALDPEVVQGIEDASDYVITPLFGVGIVSTVIGTCLVFAVIKLLLYGSGPS